MKHLDWIASALCGLAVALGAFAAHGLKPHVPPDAWEAFQTGVRYQFLHGVALLAWLGFGRRMDGPLRVWVPRCWLVGTALFSGSLYLLSTRDLLGLEVGWLGPVTPIGGLLLLTGWGLLTLGCWKARNIPWA